MTKEITVATEDFSDFIGKEPVPVQRTLRNKLLELGATESQLNAKVVTLIEDSMIDDEATRSATVRSELSELRKQASSVSFKLDKYTRDLALAQNKLDSFRDELAKADVSISEHTIKDESVIDGILAYRKMLEATVDVFGQDKMSDEVMTKAIEAASYGMWRSVACKSDSSGNKQKGYRLS